MKSNLDLIKTYLDNYSGPILISDSYYNDLSNLGVTINANCSLDLLNGYYDDNNNFVAPSWLNELNEKRLLIIRNIDSIPVNEQVKFKEIIKDNKVNEFVLNKSIVLITYGNREIANVILSLAKKV